jgi:hypothetical protein
MSDPISQRFEAVKDEETFLLFVEALVEERRQVEGLARTPDGFQGEWANASISEFLEAGVAWARDSGFGNRPGPKPVNSWQAFALFLIAGRGYE